MTICSLKLKDTKGNMKMKCMNNSFEGFEGIYAEMNRKIVLEACQLGCEQGKYYVSL